MGPEESFRAAPRHTTVREGVRRCTRCGGVNPSNVFQMPWPVTRPAAIYDTSRAPSITTSNAHRHHLRRQRQRRRDRQADFLHFGMPAGRTPPYRLDAKHRFAIAQLVKGTTHQPQALPNAFGQQQNRFRLRFYFIISNFIRYIWEIYRWSRNGSKGCVHWEKDLRREESNDSDLEQFVVQKSHVEKLFVCDQKQSCLR